MHLFFFSSFFFSSSTFPLTHSPVLVSDLQITRTPPDNGSLPIERTPAKIDSLLSGFIFPASMSDPVKTAFSSLCPGLAGICAPPFIWDGPVSFTSADLAAFPTILFVNYDLSSPVTLTPDKYLVNNFDGTYSIGISFSGDIFVMGLPFLAMYRIGIDLLFPGGYGRIGFASPTTCVSSTLVASDASTLASSTRAVTATTAATASSTTNTDLTTSLSTQTSATTSSVASLSAASTQAIIMSTLSASATGNGAAQASTTSSVSSTTTAYVAATTQATSTSRVTASSRYA